MTAARCWDVYACPGECIGRSGLWNVAPRGMTCPGCGGKVEPVRVTADTEAESRAEEAERELRVFKAGLTDVLRAYNVPAMPSWPDAIHWLARHGRQTP